MNYNDIISQKSAIHIAAIMQVNLTSFTESLWISMETKLSVNRGKFYIKNTARNLLVNISLMLEILYLVFLQIVNCSSCRFYLLIIPS